MDSAAKHTNLDTTDLVISITLRQDQAARLRTPYLNTVLLKRFSGHTETGRRPSVKSCKPESAQALDIDATRYEEESEEIRELTYFMDSLHSHRQDNQSTGSTCPPSCNTALALGDQAKPRSHNPLVSFLTGSYTTYDRLMQSKLSTDSTSNGIQWSALELSTNNVLVDSTRRSSRVPPGSREH
ncbi:hypothetical protein EJ05DRAFT_504235 [Pseudovirgaria hyperparasitica]|uniref:Uncharacterized protein n=1 Tax=Pseudovirgaria hyperparasitica TaxID=470096 RepID=A0A6A6VVD3_9PEZI|nr:uncharacterized protein EJ05DRAFT_504235 [Pseudovirgaria hyperparasitica]KAF2754125.1 hypothetical protein EJ05DRAFT_504235 [Pseudovirgaria hyperparasitica]